uniref:Cytochrome P450 n=1 Tax=Strongyloides venezuelensis TaxID=75913 RepID=A0A0K0FVA5_STRVS
MIGIGEYIIFSSVLFLIISILFSKYVAIAFITILISLIFWKVNTLKNYWKKRNIPSPKGKFGIGNILEIMNDFKNCDLKWKKEFGGTYGVMMGLRPDLATTNLDIIKEVYVKQFDKFIDREGFMPSSSKRDKSLLANGMFIKRGEDWRRIRNLCSPAFTTGKMKMFVKFFNETVDRTIEILKKYETEDKAIDMKELCDGMTIDSIFKSTFGYKTDLQENPDNIVREYAKNLFDSSIYDPKFLFILLFPEVTNIIRVYFGYHVKNNTEHNYFRDLLSECYERRKKELERGENNEAPDFFKVLLQSVNDDDDDKDKDEEIVFEEATQNQKKKGMSKIEVLSQGFLFLLAGYETTASSIHFLLFMLAHHQEYQDRCREEILEVLGEKSIDYIDYDTENKLTYLDQCVKECLRMYPPAGRINRTCVQKTTINGIDFEPGVSISVPIFNLHYDEDIYPEPNIFDPERFSPEQKAGRDPLYYMPFGYGPRNCIGMRYAYLSMKVYLARLLLKYKFKTCPESLPIPLEISARGMTKPIEKLYLKVETISDT